MATRAQLDIPFALEHAVLALIRKGEPNASWHWLATRLPSYDVPLQPDLMKVLLELRARGLVEDRLVGEGMDRWSLTEAGRARLAALETPGPLDLAGLDELARALGGDVQDAIMALIPYADDADAMTAVLRQALALDASLAEMVAFGAAMLPEEARAPFAREILDDPRPEVRAALFRSWWSARMDVPGQAVRSLAEADWDDVLRRGLADEDDAVRSAAAALAFASDRGGALADDLVAALTTPARELRFWAILALGAARDAGSLAALVRIADAEDSMFAAAAVRALAARPDGHARWLVALDDLREEVRKAAVFALAEVAVDLDDEVIAALEARPPIRPALAAYRARNAGETR